MADNSGLLGILNNQDGKVRKTKVGYTMELTSETLEKIKKHPKIIHIEEDQIVTIASVEYREAQSEISFVMQNNSSWGLSRISGHKHQYEYLKDGGKNVVVYVLDTGIDVTHPEFEGRAEFKYNAVEGSPDIDEQGHGTHCAGVIGSKSFGVAKQAKLFGVKILDKHGMGSISKLIEGIDFVIDDYLKIKDKGHGYIFKQDNIIDYIFGDQHPFFTTNKKIQAVVNMSVGGAKSVALNFAVRHASRDYNIHFSTAAGNEHKDACEYSPSSSSTSLTIGASDKKDFIASFSNNGHCVNLFAPGVEIISTWPNNRTKIASGTSMATPHVAGIMAVYLSMADFNPEELKARIIADAENEVMEHDYSFFAKKKPFASLKALYQRLKTIKQD
ncbi:uncharacterized protein LOC143921965 [Arctopsyche grandis]|uniref:uncharacterized protein LOC143921965 n=1 Tax=Arctopsyche grandis TaxID=121162 RepID=UPI00406D8676